MTKQEGFTLVEGLLIVLILSVVSFSGYFVWSQNKDNKKDTSIATQQNTNSTNEEDETSSDASDEPEEIALLSDDWKRYESGLGAYSIQFPDGLDGLRDTSDNAFSFRKFVSTDGAAIVKDQYGFGADGFFALTLSHSETADLWNSFETENLKEESFTTTAGLVGTKKTFNFPYYSPCEGAGCYLGEKQVMYEFEKGSTTTRIWYSRQVANDESRKIYSITSDSPDYTKEIEAMAKTLVIN